MPAEIGDVVRCGAELVRADNRLWLTAQDVSAPVVVFIHGFTSHGRYLAPLASHVAEEGWVTALFNYDSYRGIDRAAAELDYLLADLIQPLRDQGLALVGHSMGGLVARCFASTCDNGLQLALRGIATLGTPHRGTLSRKLVSQLLDWGDAITLPNPFARTPACRSAQQMAGSDAGRLLAALNSATSARGALVPLLSISGGLPFLEFGNGGSGGFVGALRNAVLQRLIGERPNDGLVAESSSDASRVLADSSACTHQCGYPTYDTINHSNLSRNQQVARLLLRWLRQTLPTHRPQDRGVVT